jgi:hypothetical protein
VYNDLDKKWNRGIVSYFKVLSWHGPRATEETTKILSHYTLYSGRYSNQAFLEYRWKALLLQLTCSVIEIYTYIHTYIHTQRLRQTGRRKWMQIVGIRTCSYFWVTTCLNFPRLLLFNQDSVPTKIFRWDYFQLHSVWIPCLGINKQSLRNPCFGWCGTFQNML